MPLNSTYIQVFFRNVLDTLQTAHGPGSKIYTGLFEALQDKPLTRF